MFGLNTAREQKRNQRESPNKSTSKRTLFETPIYITLPVKRQDWKARVNVAGNVALPGMQPARPSLWFTTRLNHFSLFVGQPSPWAIGIDRPIEISSALYSSSSCRCQDNVTFERITTRSLWRKPLLGNSEVFPNSATMIKLANLNENRHRHNEFSEAKVRARFRKIWTVF